MTVRQGDKLKKITAQQAMFMSAVQKATKGDVRAFLSLMALSAFALVAWRLLLNQSSKTDLDGLWPDLQATIQKQGAKGAIALCREPGMARVQVSVQDDGRGVAAAPAQPGMGLAGLRERIDVLGGEFRVEARAPAGTRVSASLPA